MTSPLSIKVAILGLSEDPDRYAYKAAERLLQKGYQKIWGVHPKAKAVLGVSLVKSLSELPKDIDTITVYVGPKILESMMEEVFALKPRRVILNPGTESDLFTYKARALGIEVREECTLVMLSLQNF